MSKNPAGDMVTRKYLRGELEGTALDDFEARLIEEPALFEKVERESALMEALKAESASLLESNNVKASRSSGFQGLLSNLARRWAMPAWPLGASTVAITACFVVAFIYRSPNLPNTELLDRIVYLDETRSSTSDAAVALVAGESVLLAIDAIEWDGAADIRITLRGENGVQEYRPGGIGDDYQFLVPVSRLKPGDYLLTVSGRGVERLYVLRAE
ncbi:MAG: hypothetical protein AAGI88_12955 [Pseudomonadota bacterium]